MNYLYKIYQIEDLQNHYMFMNYKFAKEHGFNFNDYKLIYTGRIFGANEEEVLDKLFDIFNSRYPADYKGRSLSVSDVVKVNNEYYYCDSTGWKKIENI